MYGTYCRLNMPVWASDCEVVKKTLAKMTPVARRSNRTVRREVLKAILQEHHDARKLYDKVVSGRL